MSVIGDWRTALVADLRLQYPDARVVSGDRSGTSTDNDTIAVFWPGMEEFDSAIVVGQATLTIRFWPKQQVIREDASTPDPSRLEDIGVELAAFLQTKQLAYSSTGVWFCRLTSVTPNYDPDEWMVEANVVAMFDNPAVIA